MKESNAPVIGRTPFQKWLDKYQGILYLIPWIIGFVVFKAFPFGQSLYYSFTDMNFFKSGTTFVGLQNYITAFTTPKITKALIITFKYAFITVPLKLIFALFIAYILNFKIACVNLFRTVYYIPSILGGSVAIAVLWKAVFSKDGLLNTVLRAVTFGLVQGPEWLSDPPLRAVDHLLPAYLAVRFCHGAVPGRSEGRARRPVRGCHHRRRRQVASVLLHHRPDDHPHHLLQPGHSDLPGIPGVQWPVHHHQRRPPWFHHADLSAGLQLRIQVV